MIRITNTNLDLTIELSDVAHEIAAMQGEALGMMGHISDLEALEKQLLGATRDTTNLNWRRFPDTYGEWMILSQQTGGVDSTYYLFQGRKDNIDFTKPIVFKLLREK